MLSIGVFVVMLIYWLIVGNLCEGVVDFLEFFVVFSYLLIILGLGVLFIVICVLLLVWVVVCYSSKLIVWIDCLFYLFYVVLGLVIVLLLVYFMINYVNVIY